MPRPSRPWFRFYVEALADRKLRRMTPAQRWLWVAVLGAARQSPVPGYLLVSEREPMDAHDLADIAAMPVREVTAALPKFEVAGMLHHDEGLGCWAVSAWHDRQYESDDVTKRTAKHRSKERSNDVPGNAPETDTETDTTPPTPPRSRRRSRKPVEPPNPSSQIPRVEDVIANQPPMDPDGLERVRALRAQLNPDPAAGADAVVVSFAGPRTSGEAS